MAYELRDGQGSIFRNDKQGNESRPDYTGKLNLGGVIYWVAAWVKTPQRGGEAFLSLDVQEPREHVQRDAEPQAAPPSFPPAPITPAEDENDGDQLPL